MISNTTVSYGKINENNCQAIYSETFVRGSYYDLVSGIFNRISDVSEEISSETINGTRFIQNVLKNISGA